MYRYGYGYGRGYAFDATYILVLIGALLCIIASAMVKSTYKKYAKVIIGVYILYLILNPVFEFINEEPKIDFFSEYKYEEVKQKR